jgi:hypothetical protein
MAGTAADKTMAEIRGMWEEETIETRETLETTRVVVTKETATTTTETATTTTETVLETMNGTIIEEEIMATEEVIVIIMIILSGTLIGQRTRETIIRGMFLKNHTTPYSEIQSSLQIPVYCYCRWDSQTTARLSVLLCICTCFYTLLPASLL